MSRVEVKNHSPYAITVLGVEIKPSLKAQLVETKFPRRLVAAINKIDRAGVTARLVNVDAATKPEPEVQALLLEDLKLNAQIVKKLVAGGVETLEQLTALTAENVIAINGIAKAALAEIEQALADKELALAEANNE